MLVPPPAPPLAGMRPLTPPSMSQAPLVPQVSRRTQLDHQYSNLIARCRNGASRMYQLKRPPEDWEGPYMTSARLHCCRCGGGGGGWHKALVGGRGSL